MSSAAGRSLGDGWGIHAPPLDLGIPQFGWHWILEADLSKYYLILIITIFMVISARNLMKTRVGRSFVAIRDSDIAAEVIGINLTFYKTLSFMVSAFYTGIPGVFLVLSWVSLIPSPSP